MSRIMPLMVALVPTGMKQGVVSVMPLSVICQTLAFPFWASIWKSSLGMASIVYSVIKKPFHVYSVFV